MMTLRGEGPYCKTLRTDARTSTGSALAGHALPLIELHTGPEGWTCVCHLENGTSRRRPLLLAHSRRTPLLPPSR